MDETLNIKAVELDESSCKTTTSAPKAKAKKEAEGNEPMGLLVIITNANGETNQFEATLRPMKNSETNKSLRYNFSDVLDYIQSINTEDEIGRLNFDNLTMPDKAWAMLTVFDFDNVKIKFYDSKKGNEIKLYTNGVYTKDVDSYKWLSISFYLEPSKTKLGFKPSPKTMDNFRTFVEEVYRRKDSTNGN